MKGYSLIELTIVVFFLALLVGLVSINLFQFQHTSQLSSSVSSFISDYKEQQIKAMTGDTSGTGTLSNYGIYFGTSSYTEFQNSYGTNNFSVSLPATIHVSTTFPSTQVLFLKGTGMISGFTSGQNTITLTDTVNGTKHIITVNQYGVITSVN